MTVSLLGWQVDDQTIIVGALTGLTYALLATGLVLVYRASRVINFAYAEIGAFGAVLLARALLDLHWNYWLTLPLVLVAGGAVGAAVELVVVRRLFHAPRLMLLVATLGVAQLMFVASIPISRVDNPGPYPTPLSWNWTVGSVVLGSADLMVLILAPAAIGAVTLFLNRSRYGLAIRVAADNPERAELAGISTKRMSTIVWILAGVLATLTVVLLNPRRGVVLGVPAPSLGPALMVRALTIALIARFRSLPLTLAGGLLVGVGEAIVFANVTDAGAIDALLLVAVVVLVLFRGTDLGGSGPTSSLVPRLAALPERARNTWWVRRLGPLVGGVAFLTAVALPVIITTPSRQFQFSMIAIYALVGLSVTILTGWAGQLSLSQFALVGLGAVVAAALVERGMSFPVAIFYATASGALVATIIGFPALRTSGLALAITTLALAVAAQSWILRRPVFVGDDGANTITLPRQDLFGVFDLRSQRSYYYLCLGVLTIAIAAASRLRSSGIGRTTIGTRDNELAAASFGVSPTLTKLVSFGVAGALAALAGALLAGLQVSTAVVPISGSGGFGPEQSLQVVAMAVIGGLGSVAGVVLGAVYVVGLPALFSGNDTVGLLTSGAGLLVLLLYFPGGLIELAHRARNALVRRADARSSNEGVAIAAPVAVRSLPLRAGADADRTPPTGDESETAVEVSSISLSFGGRVALDDVSLHVRSGEVVGLIGSNGAGKSTLMNVIGGALRPDSGTTSLFGVDITHLPAHERARRGVGRLFQDARLFTDLTVRETVMVALEAEERSELVPSMLALPPSVHAERRKRSQADDYIGFLGLGRYADAFVGDLSTGTRRIVELSCLLAQNATLLLLDEPTAGVAQRETEALGPLLRRIQAELGATLLLIEHDMPMVMSISDRVYCLSAGTCIAEGLPDDVRRDPLVVSAYLGTDERAIARSGAPVPT